MILTFKKPILNEINKKIWPCGRFGECHDDLSEQHSTTGDKPATSSPV